MSHCYFLRRTSDYVHEKKRRAEDVRCFCPVWAKVLANERPFCSLEAVKESDFSNRDILVSQLIPSGPDAFQRRGPAWPAELRDRPRIRLQHSPNIERNPCSNHREPVPWSANSACVSSSPNTVHQWANVSASSPPLRAGAVPPWPLKWISSITLVPRPFATIPRAIVSY